jgi:hypothetical protein
MSQITLRDVPEDVKNEIKKIARERNTSMNRVINRLLRESLGMSSSGVKKRDLSEFSAEWSPEEADEFDKAVEVFERIDDEMWK